MKHMIIVGALLVPSQLAAQPYSESMADCAAIYQNAAQWMETKSKVDKLMFAAGQWAEAAFVQAQAEGNKTSKSAMWTKIDEKTDVWEAKGILLFGTEEFRDWTKYCRSFAKDRGITIDP